MRVLWLGLMLIGALAQGRGLLPLGDGQVSRAPRAGFVFSCQRHFPPGGIGAVQGGSWLGTEAWNPAIKPVVQGQVRWPQARLRITVQGAVRVVSANNLPRHPTGRFPIAPDDPAHRYDPNPNAIRPQDVLLRLPASPRLAVRPRCLPMGMIGFTLSGAALFSALDARGQDAPAHEMQDACHGHPEVAGQYHYHDLSPCLHDDAGRRGRHSALLGYALDGFGIYGPYGDGGRELTNADLDACHGRSDAVEWDGRRVVMYHYVLTRMYPYSVGCFRGTPP